jgi:peptidoglycan/LPS O-acetylase OafA/YrhL
VWVLLDVGSQTFKYLGAETVNAVAAAAVVAHLLVAPGGAWSARLLSLPPLRWLGTRSYAIYLWHWPMAVWTGGMAHRVGVPLGIAASLALAELSWRLVEQPAQRLRRRLQPAPAEVRQLQRV